MISRSNTQRSDVANLSMQVVTNRFGIHCCQNKSNTRAPSVTLFQSISRESRKSRHSRTFSQVLARSRKFSQALASSRKFSQAPLRVFLPPSLSRGPGLIWYFSPFKITLFFSKKNDLICLSWIDGFVLNQVELTFSGKRVFRERAS